MPLGIRVAVWVVVVLAAIALTGCQSIAGPADVAGEFQLTTVNGQLLPFRVGRSIAGVEVTTVDITSGWLTLNADGSYHWMTSFFTQVRNCRDSSCDIHQTVKVDSRQGVFVLGAVGGGFFVGGASATANGSKMTLAEAVDGTQRVFGFERSSR